MSSSDAVQVEESPSPTAPDQVADTQLEEPALTELAVATSQAALKTYVTQAECATAEASAIAMTVAKVVLAVVFALCLLQGIAWWRVSKSGAPFIIALQVISLAIIFGVAILAVITGMSLKVIFLLSLLSQYTCLCSLTALLKYLKHNTAGTMRQKVRWYLYPLHFFYILLLVLGLTNGVPPTCTSAEVLPVIFYFKDALFMLYFAVLICLYTQNFFIDKKDKGQQQLKEKTGAGKHGDISSEQSFEVSEKVFRYRTKRLVHYSTLCLFINFMSLFMLVVLASFSSHVSCNSEGTYQTYSSCSTAVFVVSMIKISILFTAFTPRVVFVRTVKQIEQRWQQNLKGMGTDFRRGLSLNVVKDEHSDTENCDINEDTESTPQQQRRHPSHNASRSKDQQKRLRNMSTKSQSSVMHSRVQSQEPTYLLQPQQQAHKKGGPGEQRETLETQSGEYEHYEEIEMETERCETEGDLLVKTRKEPVKKTCQSSRPPTKLQSIAEERSSLAQSPYDNTRNSPDLEIDYDIEEKKSTQSHSNAIQALQERKRNLERKMEPTSSFNQYENMDPKKPKSHSGLPIQQQTHRQQQEQGVDPRQSSIQCGSEKHPTPKSGNERQQNLPTVSISQSTGQQSVHCSLKFLENNARDMESHPFQSGRNNSNKEPSWVKPGTCVIESGETGQSEEVFKPDLPDDDIRLRIDNQLLGGGTQQLQQHNRYQQPPSSNSRVSDPANSAGLKSSKTKLQQVTAYPHQSGSETQDFQLRLSVGFSLSILPKPKEHDAQQDDDDDNMVVNEEKDQNWRMNRESILNETLTDKHVNKTEQPQPPKSIFGQTFHDNSDDANSDNQRYTKRCTFGGNAPGSPTKVDIFIAKQPSSDFIVEEEEEQSTGKVVLEKQQLHRDPNNEDKSSCWIASDDQSKGYSADGNGANINTVMQSHASTNPMIDPVSTPFSAGQGAFNLDGRFNPKRESSSDNDSAPHRVLQSSHFGDPSQLNEKVQSPQLYLVDNHQPALAIVKPTETYRPSAPLTTNKNEESTQRNMMITPVSHMPSQAAASISPYQTDGSTPIPAHYIEPLSASFSPLDQEQAPTFPAPVPIPVQAQQPMQPPPPSGPRDTAFSRFTNRPKIDILPKSAVSPKPAADPVQEPPIIIVLGQDNGRETPDDAKEKRPEFKAKFAARIEEKDEQHKGGMTVGGEVPFDIAGNDEIDVIYMGTDLVKCPGRLDSLSGIDYEAEAKSQDDSSDYFSDDQSEILKQKVEYTDADGKSFIPVDMQKRPSQRPLFGQQFGGGLEQDVMKSQRMNRQMTQRNLHNFNTFKNNSDRGQGQGQGHYGDKLLPGEILQHDRNQSQNHHFQNANKQSFSGLSAVSGGSYVGKYTMPEVVGGVPNSFISNNNPAMKTLFGGQNRQTMRKAGGGLQVPNGQGGVDQWSQRIFPKFAPKREARVLAKQRVVMSHMDTRVVNLFLNPTLTLYQKRQRLESQDKRIRLVQQQNAMMKFRENEKMPEDLQQIQTSANRNTALFPFHMTSNNKRTSYLNNAIQKVDLRAANEVDTEAPGGESRKETGQNRLIKNILKKKGEIPLVKKHVHFNIGTGTRGQGIPDEEAIPHHWNEDSYSQTIDSGSVSNQPHQSVLMAMPTSATDKVREMELERRVLQGPSQANPALTRQLAKQEQSLQRQQKAKKLFGNKRLPPPTLNFVYIPQQVGKNPYLQTHKTDDSVSVSDIILQTSPDNQGVQKMANPYLFDHMGTSPSPFDDKK